MSESIYLSPQQMSQIEEGDQIVEYDIFKSDVFSLGVNMIGMLTGQTMDSYYDYQQYQIDHKGIITQLGVIKQKWGLKVVYLLQEMV